MLNICDNGHQQICFYGYEGCPLCEALKGEKSISTRLQEQLDNSEEEKSELQRKADEAVAAAQSLQTLIGELKEISGNK